LGRTTISPACAGEPLTRLPIMSSAAAAVHTVI
jgi:hypothetical protein